MKFTVYTIGNYNIAELEAEKNAIANVQDALDLMANADYMGADNIIIRKEHLSPEFFDLKSGMAGEMLQKFSNYRKCLAIVGDFSKYNSKSLTDFMRESNRVGRIIFTESIAEAQKRLAGQV